MKVRLVMRRKLKPLGLLGQVLQRKAPSRVVLLGRPRKERRFRLKMTWITMMKIMIALKTTLCRGSQFKEKIMTLKKGSLPFKTDVLPQSSLRIVSR